MHLTDLFKIFWRFLTIVGLTIHIKETYPYVHFHFRFISTKLMPYNFFPKIPFPLKKFLEYGIVADDFQIYESIFD